MTLPLLDDVRCFLIGDDSTFLVDIKKPYWTVEHLRMAIKAYLNLAIFNPNKLTLYRAAIRGYPDKEMRIGELNRLCGNLNECKELDDEDKKLSEILGESPPPEKNYYIIVQPPIVVSSVYVCNYNLYASVDAAVSPKACLQNLQVSTHAVACPTSKRKQSEDIGEPIDQRFINSRYELLQETQVKGWNPWNPVRCL